MPSRRICASSATSRRTYFGCTSDALSIASSVSPDMTSTLCAPAVTATAISAQTGVPNAQICCVGDRLYTDIAVAVNAGAQSVLVMSGETDEAILKASDVQPKYVLRDVAELAQILRGGTAV